MEEVVSTPNVTTTLHAFLVRFVSASSCLAPNNRGDKEKNGSLQERSTGGIKKKIRGIKKKYSTTI